MTRNQFIDHLFDLLNESDYLDAYNIETIENGFRVTVGDGTMFNVVATKAEPKDNIIQLYPNREE